MSEERRQAGWLSSIISNGRWYLLSSVITKALALLTLTLLTRSLPPAEFGALNAMMALTQALPIVLSLYLDSALARLYHEFQHDRRQLATLFSTVFWFVLIWGSVSLIVISIVASRLSLGTTSVPLTYFWIATVPPLLLQLAQLGVMFLRQSFESRTVSKIEVWGALIGAVATYFLVTIGGEGVLGRLWAIALSSAYVFSYVIWHFTKAGLLVLRFDRRKLKENLAFSLPLLPNLLAGWVAGTSDRLIIAKYVDLDAVGVYSLAASIASLLYVVQDAVTQVTGVKTQVGMSTDRKRTLCMISELSIVMWVVMLFVNYCAVAYSVELIELFTGAGYQGAASLIGACGFIYVLAPQNRLLQDLIGFNKKAWIISSGALIMAVCSLALNFCLVPRFGYIVAPYVFILATIAQTMWLYGWVYRLERLTLHWRKAAFAFTVFIGFVFINQMVGADVAAKIVATGIYAVVTYGMLAAHMKMLGPLAPR
jgi:O-antigen/teichoic acid export membrane protein